mmetsp:Transcript_10972/g.14481  ORF Transcript_10972/g.14481 Transcript_10972/m.14481 type:complete len:110 (+) Transcript_10972:118-447(+)
MLKRSNYLGGSMSFSSSSSNAMWEHNERFSSQEQEYNISSLSSSTRRRLRNDLGLGLDPVSSMVGPCPLSSVTSLRYAFEQKSGYNKKQVMLDIVQCDDPIDESMLEDM